MRLLAVLLALAVSFPVVAQDKDKKKPAAKKTAPKKKAEPKQQDWGHFSSGAKKDQKAMEEKKAKK